MKDETDEEGRMTALRRRLRTEGRTRSSWTFSSWTLGMLLASALGGPGCASPPPREPIAIAPTLSLRAGSELLLDEVEVDDHAPDWLARERVDQGIIYGIGIQTGSGDDSEDLFLAMHAARRSIVVWLESRGAGAEGQNGHPARLRIDPERVQFERLARDTRSDRWYALARLEIASEVAQIEAAVQPLEAGLAALQQRIGDAGISDGARAQAALALVEGVDLRQQYNALYHALTGGELATPPGLEDATLLARANELLAQHGVRVAVDGGFVPGLFEAVTDVLAEFHLRTDEFGRGLVSVQIHESKGFGADNPYLEIDGFVEIAIEGGDEPGRSTPFHAVSTGATLDEARFRVAREIRAEVARIVRETLRAIGGSAA
jgi:hypothetical protein